MLLSGLRGEKAEMEQKIDWAEIFGRKDLIHREPEVEGLCPKCPSLIREHIRSVCMGYFLSLVLECKNCGCNDKPYHATKCNGMEQMELKIGG